MALFPGTPKWEFWNPKTRITTIPKIWPFISSSNQAYLKHGRTLFYNLQKDLFNVYGIPQLEFI
jgi:hypothetical protein